MEVVQQTSGRVMLVLVTVQRSVGDALLLVSSQVISVLALEELVVWVVLLSVRPFHRAQYHGRCWSV